MRKREFVLLPERPKGQCPEIRPSWAHLERTRDSVSGLFHSFEALREQSGSNRGGRPRSSETDILRAALVFTSSGVDACCKLLLRDTLPRIIEVNPGAARRFERFLLEAVKSPASHERLHSAMISPSPREALLGHYIEFQTVGSLQGSKELRSKVRDSLGIPNSRIASAHFAALDPFFLARNQIVHEMDFEAMNRGPRGRTSIQRQRKLVTVKKQCGQALLVVAELILAASESVRRGKI